jgi:hypothetical protein
MNGENMNVEKKMIRSLKRAIVREIRRASRVERRALRRLRRLGRRIVDAQS